MRMIPALLAALALSGCARGPVVISLPRACLPLKTWSAADQDALRREYDALAPAAKLRAAFQDYVAMRDEARACFAASASGARDLH